MANDDLLRRENHGAVARLVMTSPKNFNALSTEMIAALRDALDAIAADEAVRVVVIAAEGKAFSAGHDLRQMQAARAEADGGRGAYESLFADCAALMQAIPALPQPVIARLREEHSIYALDSGRICVAAIEGSYADREDSHDETWDREKRIVPLRVAEHFVVHELGPNPIGMSVFGADRQVAGTVSDLWVDRGESMVRYYEVELGAGGRRVLMPATFCRTGRFSQRVTCEALLAHQFADVPTTKDPDSVTLNEEERIMAFYGGGTLYATAQRQESFL